MLPAAATADVGADGFGISDEFHGPSISMGGSTISAPAAVSASSGRIDLWARGTTGAVQHDVWKSSGWSGWSTTWLAGPRP
jgi:hypothetical protein